MSNFSNQASLTQALSASDGCKDGGKDGKEGKDGSDCIHPNVPEASHLQF